MNATKSHQSQQDDTAEYHRPEWMSGERWQEVSATMTETWLTLLAAAQDRVEDRGQAVQLMVPQQMEISRGCSRRLLGLHGARQHDGA